MRKCYGTDQYYERSLLCKHCREKKECSQVKNKKRTMSQFELSRREYNHKKYLESQQNITQTTPKIEHERVYNKENHRQIRYSKPERQTIRRIPNN